MSKAPAHLEVNAASLQTIEIFSDLSLQEREQLVSRCRGHSYQVNQIILSHQDNTREVFFVLSGTARVTIYSNSGKQTTFRDIRAGQMFGELSALDEQPRSAHVIAHTPCSAIFMRPEDFCELLEIYPQVAFKILRYLSGLVRLLSDRVVEFSTLGVKNRIHAELLRLAREAGVNDNMATLDPAPTHLEIAHCVSSHREAVTREMGVLLKQGIISKQENTLVFADVSRLQKLVDEIVVNNNDLKLV